MATFTIDKTDFNRGISLTENHNNGGFSGAREGIGLFAEQAAILYPQPARTDLDADNSDVVTDNVVCFAADPTFLGNDGYALDEDGKFYTIDGSTVTLRQTDATNSYNDGTSDMLVYKNSLFATSTTDIAKLDGSDLTSLDHDWWTNTLSKSALSSTFRHPMEIVEDILYIADEYKIHTWDGTTAVASAMLLPDDYNITNLIKHTDGRHLLAFVSQTANAGHTKKAAARCFVIDTVNLEFVREIEIDAQVEGSRNVGGVIYVTYGNKLGYFNGDGISFLRKIESATTYKHQLANVDDILLVRDENGILAYGDLGLGNIFWYVYADERTAPQREIDAIYYAGDNTVLLSSTGRLLDLIDLDTFAGASNFDSNFYSFPEKVWIRKITVECETLASGSDITLHSVDKNGTATELFDLTFAADGAIDFKEKFVNIYITSLWKLRVAFAAGNTKGIRSVTIHYESAE